jgi:hypothetical protein
MMMMMMEDDDGWDSSGQRLENQMGKKKVQIAMRRQLN